MNKSDSKNMQSSPIFYQLKEEKLISSEEYDRLMKVMKKLKYSDFLTREQGMITLKFLRGENVFGVLPTSGGKSFTFQTVARMTEGLTIVISPLIALMKDQVGKHRDGASLYFNSDLSPFQRKDVKRRIREGKVRLLYISPERLKSTDFKELLDSSSQRVKRFVIDEAHCVIEWGYGFRVKYLHIAQEIEAFEKRLGNKIPVLLLTATASPWLQHETAKKLKVKIPSKNFIIQLDDADRPELVIKTQLMGDKKKKIIWLAKQFAKGGAFHKKRGIIFSAYAEGGESNDVHNAPQICEDLQKIGVKKIGYYHGQMNLDERKEVHKKFKKGDLDILVATKAFGMGMDLLGLKFIVHFYPPISLEEYWQEAGRGGRGMDAEAGEYCDCVVLHSPSDKDILNNFTISKGFVNILSTFTCATQDIVCFNVKEIAGGGRLRMLLNELRKQKDIRGLKSLKIGNAAIERWKLLKPANTILSHIDRLIQNEVVTGSKQIRRKLENKLRLRYKRKGKLIRVSKQQNFLNSDLNWFTEPEVEALAMIDDEMVDSEIYTRFEILKRELPLKDVKALSAKVNASRISIKNKFNHVHDHFLKAKRGKEKDVILNYLKIKKTLAK